MFGSGLLKGLGITLQHVRDSFTDDRKDVPSRYEDSVEMGNNRRIMRQPGTQEGLLTLKYPEEKRQIPERFRYIPMLIFDTETNEDRCTSCGICAKVCPPQCIWIVRTNDPSTGRPVPVPTNFYIDMDICMNCGFCAEYCPFDAIKMDHDFDIASYERNVYNLDKLLKPASYYNSIRPENAAREDEARRAKEALKAAKAEAKPAAA